MVNKLSLTRIDRNGKDEKLLAKWCLLPEEDILDVNKYLEINVNDLMSDDEIHKISKNIYIKLLPALVVKLNNQLNDNFTEDQWEILIGHWLLSYIENIVYRVDVIKKIENDNYYVELIDQSGWIVADNCDEFSTLLFDDYFNHQMLGEIIKHGNYIRCEKLNAIKKIQKMGRKTHPKLFLKFIDILTRISVKRSTSVISKTYLSNSLLINGWLSGMWTPVVKGIVFVSKKNKIVNYTERKKRLRIDLEGDEYFKIAKDLLPIFIPKVLFEDLHEIFQFGSLTKPRELKNLITANPNALGECIKIWAMMARARGGFNYYIIQHGSNYGQAKIISDEYIEQKVADAYLTSGWDVNLSKDNNNLKVYKNITISRLSKLKGTFSTLSHKRSNNIVVVLASFPRYYYSCWSSPQGIRFPSYIESVLKLKELSPSIFQKIKLREYTYEYGWGEVEIYKKNGFNFTDKKNRKPLMEYMQNAQLTIFTYNSTAFLEAMALNIPCICYWDKKEWEWRDSAIDTLNDLSNSNIYHSSFESLSLFLNQYEMSINEWWNSKSVQESRKRFCNLYARTTCSQVNKWKNLIGGRC